MRTQLRHMWREIDERLGDRPAPPLLSVSQTLGVVRRELINDKPPRADNFDKYKICEAGDVVLNRFNAYRGSLGISNERGIVSPDYLVLRANGNSHPKFLDFLLRSEELSNFMKSTMGGLGASDPDVSGFSRIDVRALGQYSVPSLEFQKQHTVAAFLDRETVQIDELIGKQGRLIELLDEKRQAIITHAVTKGLDPAAPTKPSGVPWLGDVPAAWNVSKLNWQSKGIGDGLHGTPTYSDTGSIPFVNGTNLLGDSIRITDSTNFVEEDQLSSADVSLDESTVLISINGTVGNCAVLGNQRVMLSKSAAYIKCSESLNAQFLAHYLRSYPTRSYFVSASGGTTIANLSLATLRGTPVPVPPFQEQMEVTRWLDEQIHKLDGLRTKSLQAIALLRERRSALISAAVTGKIDVTNEGVAA